MKKIILILLVIANFIGCGKDSKNVGDKKKELTLVVFGEHFKREENAKKLQDEYSKENPGVSLKVEVLPATEYDNTMKIRSSGNKLPDLFVTRVTTMQDFKNKLKPLNGTKAAKENRFAEDYAIDGTIYGVPMYGFNEYVYYRKSIFNELNINIPKTWKEFLDIQEVIKKDGKYTPMALGGKDSWATYPYNEFMPFLEEGGKNIWDKMANDDAPFTKGKPFYEAYKKINDYYNKKLSGDALGYGFNQSRDMLIAKKAAMLTAGQWFYEDYIREAGETGRDDIGVFILPTRNSSDETTRYLVTAEFFIGINKDSKNIDEAQKFLDWLFVSEYYKDYINQTQVLSATKENGNMGIFSEAISAIDKPEIILQKGGGEEYKKIANYISFDVKKMGQEMLNGVNFEEYMNEYNKKWQEARKNVK